MTVQDENCLQIERNFFRWRKYANHSSFTHQLRQSYLFISFKLKMMTNCFFFSEDVTLIIFNYLINQDQISFISANHFFYQQWIQKFRVINLHEPLSELFFVNKEFRQKILSKIHNPFTQLSLLGLPLSEEQGRCTVKDMDKILNISGLHRLEVDIEVFDYLMRKADSHGIEHIEHLSVKDCSHLDECILNVSYLRKVTQSLNLDRLTLTDSLEDYLSPTLNELSLHYCQLREVSDDEEEQEGGGLLLLPPLPNLKKLVLKNTFIGNLDKFQHLHDLVVEIDERMIEDHHLVHFQHVPNLTIACCEGIVDISCLQDNHNIRIAACSNVIDYSRCMTKSKIIALQFPFNAMNILLDISVFSLVEELTIDFCNCLVINNQISSKTISTTLQDVILRDLSFGVDLNLFQSVTFIILEERSGITSLQGLENVEEVVLIKLSELTSLEGLGRNKEVTVISCSKVTDFSSIRFVPIVQIQACDGFTKAEDVAEVSELTIINCSQLKDISALRKVHTLTVKSCPQITSIKELQNVVPVLSISNCKTLRKYEVLPHFDLGTRDLKISNGLERIPDSVYRDIILEFLEDNERVDFLSTNSYLYQILMKKTRQIILSKQSSLQLFFTSPIYLNAILERIENPLKQLQLMVASTVSKFVVRSDFYCPGYQTLEVSTDSFFELCQSSVKMSSSTSDSEGLETEQNDWKVYHLAFVRDGKVPFQKIEPYLYKVDGNLNIHVGDRITSLDNLSSSLEKLHVGYSEETVLSLPPLPKLKILSISRCTIKNLADFRYLQELFLNDLAIKDVTPFQNIQKITFNNCTKLQNISPLQSQRFIKFRDCAQLLDYRNALSRCKEIVIDYNSSEIYGKLLIDLSKFQYAERISLTLEGKKQTIKMSHGIPTSLKEIELIGNFHFDNKFSGFHGLKKVILASCSFKSLVGFGLNSVREVELSSLKQLTTLEGLQLQPGAEAMYRSVEINYCPKIKDFRALNYLHKVSITNCNGFRNGAQVDHVHELLIDYCSNLRDISMLKSIPKLRITNSQRVEAQQNPRFVAFNRIFP